MQSWWTVASAVLAVFAVIGAGWWLRRLHWLTQEADESLMALVVRVLVPCLIAANVLGNPVLRDPRNLALPPVLGLGFLALGLGVSLLAARVLGRGHGHGLENRTAQRTFAFANGVYNYYYIPLALVGPPLVAAESVRAVTGVLMVWMVGTELGMWTLGVFTLTGGLQKGWWKHVLNAPAVAVVVCVALNLARLDAYIPPLVLKPALWLGQCAVPLALLLIGAIIQDHGAQVNWRGSGVVLLAAGAVRLGILPALWLGLAKVLPMSPELRWVMVLQAAMPAAMFPIVITRVYGGDLPTALRVVIGTCIAGLVTIPLWLSLGMHWLGG